MIEATFNVSGQSITICDTAGLRTLTKFSDDQLIEKEGMKRARIKAKTCDIIIFVTDSEIDDEAVDELTEIEGVLKENPHAVLIKVMNKVDLKEEHIVDRKIEKGCDMVKTSCVTNVGIDDLLERIGKAVKLITGRDDPSSFTFLNRRHESILSQVNFVLSEATENMDRDLAIVGHHLKRAADLVSELTGHISNDDVLDVIFSKFCIGK